MREVAFIKQNKEKWLEVEQVIGGKLKKNPDDLSSLYINLVNDLSFAQTYYPKSKTTVYLNHLSAQIFQKIYKTKRLEENRLLYFFKTEVPLLVFQYRRYLMYAFAFFFLFVLIGAFSAEHDPEIVKIFMPNGEDYFEQTVENIKKGDPIAVYGKGSNWGSWIVITLNNLKVGAVLYIMGIFGGVGSLYLLLKNSIMLGGFQYFFYQNGALLDSARGIWVHGTFEIFAMVIEAFAGLVLGASILFPKTLSRLESFKNGFRDSFKIFFSTVPFTIVAGILEGFVTRYALKMPFALNITIILLSLVIIGFYYLIYPKIVLRKTQIIKENLSDSHAVL